MDTLEALGRFIAYRFSLLPKWARACFWATFLTVLIFAVLGGAALLCVVVVTALTQALGTDAVILLLVALVGFLITLSAVWDNIADGKRKNSE